MKPTHLLGTSAYLSLAIAGCLLACSQNSQIPADGHAVSQNRQRLKFSDWSPPANIGPPIDSEFDERFPTISPDGLSLYFSSDRPGGFGRADMYVSKRATADSPWGQPQNLGPKINSSGDDHSQNFSSDGHWMWFASDRPGGCGELDIWVSYRKNTKDDNAWEAPVNLGCSFNSASGESCPFYHEDQASGINTLYLVSGRPGGLGGWDIYASTQQKDQSFGAPVLLKEVSSPQGDFHFAPRVDGLEAVIWSNRAGGFGLMDIWVSTRASTQDAWSTPVNMGPTINTKFNEEMPSLSTDSTELYFTSDRPGGQGSFDLYVSKRKKLPD
jgi:Tol biopolymer transport system component